MSKFEEVLNLPELDEIRKNLNEQNDEEPIKEYDGEEEGITDLSATEKELDEISNTLFNDYKDLMQSALDMTARESGEILKSAVSMADISLKARIAKADLKLRNIALKMKKPNDVKEIIHAEGISMDRNELLKMLKESK